jgi:two-component system phosphate regulon response regulator PhoB
MPPNPTVLIVEDEPSIGHIVATEFEKQGFRVLRANNGDDGLALAINEKPDAVVLDIIMPGLHGYEVCQKIRQHPALQRTVIVMTSAKSYKTDIEKAFEMGADEYVVKPGGLGEVVEVVLKHLHKRSHQT